MPLRRHAWWLLPELLAIAVLAAGLAYARPVGLQQQLADRVETILERISPAEHHSHGHEVSQEDHIICAAEPFGVEPKTAKRIEEVHTIYAYYLCAAGEPGTEWDFSSRISGPVVVTLTEPPAVRIAESGAGYPDRVRAMIPDELEAKAFAGFSDPDRPAALRARYEDEVA